MKKLLFILTFLISICSYAQITKFQADVSAVNIAQNGFSEWIPDNSIIIVDFYDSTVTVLSKDPTIYKISSSAVVTNSERSIILEFQGFEKNEPLYLEFIMFMGYEARHFYIRKKDKEIVYQMRKI